MPNIALLKQTLQYIEAHPDEWDQAHWRCRTGMCFAGHACSLGGGTWYSADPTDAYRGELLADDDDPEIDRFIHHDDVHVVEAADRGRRILGLTIEQADDLFHQDNTLDDLRRIVTSLCGEAS